MGAKGSRETTVSDGKITMPEESEKKKTSPVLPIALGLGALLIFGGIVFMLIRRNKNKKEEGEGSS